VQKLIIFNRSV